MTIVETLHSVARALTPKQVRLRTPLHVLTGEATDVARFFDRYYRAERVPGSGVLLRPGLESLGVQRLPEDTAERINVLVQQVQAAQAQYQLTAETPLGDEDLERARFVLSEIIAALEFLFDDGIEDERDAQLSQVREANDEPQSNDAIAEAMIEYAALAENYRQDLDGFGDFEVAMIDEVPDLATKLRERSAPRENEQPARDALDWRNRLGTVLSDEVALVRRAARFVFRHHPQVRREASSVYERRLRAARRRAEAKAK